MFDSREPSYVTTLGLHRAPFAGSLAPEEAFLHPNLEQRLDLLRALVEFGDRWLCVYGPEGSGKSTLMQLLLARASGHWATCVLQGTPEVTTLALLKGLASCLGSELGNSRSELVDALLHRIQSLYIKSYVTVLVVDDAHRLSAQALTDLVHLVHSHAELGSLFRLVAFSERSPEELLPDLKDRENGRALAQAVPMPRISRSDSSKLLDHRLRRAGLAGSSPFSAEDLADIYRRSQGYPGPLLAQADRILDQGSSPIKTRGQLFFPKLPIPRLSSRPLAWSGTAVLLAALGSMLWFQDEINDWFGTSGSAQSVASPVSQLRSPALALPTPQGSAATGEESRRREEWLSQDKSAEIEKTAPRELSIEVADPYSMTDVGDSSAQDQVRVLRAPDSEWEAAILPTSVSSTGSDTEEIAAEATPVTQDSGTLSGIGSDGGQLSQNSEKLSRTDQAARTSANHGEAAQERLKGAARHNGLAHRELWILQQLPSQYSIQLLAMREEDSVRGFIEKHDLKGQVAYAQTQGTRGKWFALLYGIYPDRTSAQAAAAALARQLGVQPWVRKLASVQRDLANSDR